MAKDSDLNIELTKVLGKIMQSSYKRKEATEIMERIMKKIESRADTRTNQTEIKALRLEFEEIRKNFYDLQ